jgi:hypothetical protein
VVVNQNDTALGGQWNLLGSYTFEAGGGYVEVSSENGQASADAVRLGTTSNATISAGDTFTSSGSFTDPDTDTWTATVDYGDGSGVGPLTLNSDNAFALSHTYASAAGSPYTITVAVDDGLAEGTATAQVTVNAGNNVAPTATITAPPDGTTVIEGTAITFTGTASDPEDGGLTASLAWASSIDGALGAGGSVPATLTVGTHTITASAMDSGGLPGSDTILVTVNAVHTVTLTAQLQGKINRRTGLQKIRLRWFDAVGTNIDVYKNGVFVETTANDGSYTESVVTGAYVFQICETAGLCSNEALISF